MVGGVVGAKIQIEVEAEEPDPIVVFTLLLIIYVILLPVFITLLCNCAGSTFHRVSLVNSIIIQVHLLDLEVMPITIIM